MACTELQETGRLESPHAPGPRRSASRTLRPRTYSTCTLQREKLTLVDVRNLVRHIHTAESAAVAIFETIFNFLSTSLTMLPQCNTYAFSPSRLRHAQLFAIRVRNTLVNELHVVCPFPNRSLSQNVCIRKTKMKISTVGDDAENSSSVPQETAENIICR
jgi:hypothetical protein